MKRSPSTYAVTLALLLAAPALAQAGTSSMSGLSGTPGDIAGDINHTDSSSLPIAASPMGYLAIGGGAALFGTVWLTRRHRSRGQVSW